MATPPTRRLPYLARETPYLESRGKGKVIPFDFRDSPQICPVVLGAHIWVFFWTLETNTLHTLLQSYGATRPAPPRASSSSSFDSSVPWSFGSFIFTHFSGRPEKNC